MTSTSVKKLPYIMSNTFVTIMIGTKPVTVNDQQPNFRAVVSALRDGRWSEIPDLVTPAKAVVAWGQGKVTVVNGVVNYNGKPLHGVVTDRILKMMTDGFDITPMVNFLQNLMGNPSKAAVDELYLWLEKSKLPITDDGHFLAYKKVQNDYGSYYDRGKTKNLIGTVVEMPRNQVDDKRDTTCSYGLHFCSLSYLPHYMGGQGRVVIVKVNPADVVSIPSDYDNAKGRACKYTVIGEHFSETTEAFTSSVWTAPKATPAPAPKAKVAAKKTTAVRDPATGRFMKKPVPVAVKTFLVSNDPVLARLMQTNNTMVDPYGDRIAGYNAAKSSINSVNPWQFGNDRYRQWHEGFMMFVRSKA